MKKSQNKEAQILLVVARIREIQEEIEKHRKKLNELDDELMKSYKSIGIW